MNRELSLLDAAEFKTTDWFLIYPPRPVARWWGRHLDPKFRHVELERPLYYGPATTDVMWLQVTPAHEMLDVQVSVDPAPPWVRQPQAIVQKATSARKWGSMRSWFDVGPTTCVEVVKLALGIRAFWVRTPYQLYKYINRRSGVIISGAE